MAKWFFRGVMMKVRRWWLWWLLSFLISKRMCLWSIPLISHFRLRLFFIFINLILFILLEMLCPLQSYVLFFFWIEYFRFFKKIFNYSFWLLSDFLLFNLVNWFRLYEVHLLCFTFLLFIIFWLFISFHLSMPSSSYLI